MTTYLDIRARLAGMTDEAQGNEAGSTDKFEDCVLAGGALQGELYTGHDDWEPGAIRAEINREDHTANTHDGEYFTRMAKFMVDHPANYPGLPPQLVDSSAKIPSHIIEQARRGWGMNVGVFCDAQAIINSRGPFQHCAVISRVADDGLTLWANGFYGGQVDLSWAQFAADSTSDLWTFQGAYPFLLPNTNPTPARAPQEDDMSLVPIGPLDPAKPDGSEGTTAFAGIDTRAAGSQVWLHLWADAEDGHTAPAGVDLILLGPGVRSGIQRIPLPVQVSQPNRWLLNNAGIDGPFEGVLHSHSPRKITASLEILRVA